VREKETYAIVLMLLKFRSWLASSTIHIKVLTDHMSLKDWYTEDLNSMIGSVGRRGRWQEFLSQYNLTVCYVKGKHHHVSDALSRWAYPAGLDGQDTSWHEHSKAKIYADLCDKMERLYDDFGVTADTVLTMSHYFNSILTNKWDYTPTIWADVVLRIDSLQFVQNFHVKEDKLYYNDKICLPLANQEAVLQYYHSFGHPGGQKLLLFVWDKFLFEVDKTVILKLCITVSKHCQVCQAVKQASGRMQPGTMDYWPVPEDIFHSLAMDFLSLPVCTVDTVQYDYCFVIVDRLSGYIFAITCV